MPHDYTVHSAVTILQRNLYCQEYKNPARTANIYLIFLIINWQVPFIIIGELPDVNSPIKVNHVSDSVTELSISDFTDSFVTGTYVCTGAHEDSAVPVVIGDATNMDNTTIPDIPDQSCKNKGRLLFY